MVTIVREAGLRSGDGHDALAVRSEASGRA